MTDLEIWKAISSAIRDVPADKIPEAVAKVRAIIAANPPASPERAHAGGHDRKERGGRDRSE
jgi:hypothetical protein